MNYDVFISCKSEDYPYAEEIYNFLKEHGITVFLSNRELRKLGESEYRTAITQAMESAYHLIVFASKAEYIKSTWVYYEWDMFVNAKLKGFKQGQILTILKDVNVNDIAMDLWKYESLTFENYKERLLNYVETPESLQRKKNEQKEKREQSAKEIAELKANLRTYAEEYKNKYAAITSVDIPKIYSVMRKLNMNTRECPICHTQNNLEELYCAKCGWVFSPIDNIPGLEYLSDANPSRENLSKAVYAKAERPVTSPKKTSRMVYVFMVILLLMVILFAGLWVSGMNQVVNIQNKPDRTENQLSSAGSMPNKIRQNRPLVVTDISIWNDGEESNCVLYSSKATYIYFSAEIYSLINIEKDLIYVKIYSPIGLESRKSSPEGYTYSEEISVSESGTTTIIHGWGSDEPGHWKAGEYRIEFWYQNQCIKSKDFSIEK
jgi:hypothetical protein